MGGIRVPFFGKCPLRDIFTAALALCFFGAMSLEQLPGRIWSCGGPEFAKAGRHSSQHWRAWAMGARKHTDVGRNHDSPLLRNTMLPPAVGQMTTTLNSVKDVG